MDRHLTTHVSCMCPLHAVPATPSRAVDVVISSRLDYCNSLLHGISDTLLRRLQPVQNAAARLVTGTRRCDHITSVLQQLHWLPVHQRVKFKLAVLVYKAFNNLAPPYLSDDCQLVATIGRRQLRSSENFKCTVSNSINPPVQCRIVATNCNTIKKTECCSPRMAKKHTRCVLER